MTYLEKEEQLIKRLHETNYATAANGNKEVALQFLGESFDNIAEYAKEVVHYETQMKIASATCDTPQEYQERAMELDRHRKSVHDNAMNRLAAINRICVNSGLPPFADIDTNDRHAVAQFIGEYVSQVYAKGTNTTSPQKSKQRLADLDRRFGDIAQQNNEIEGQFE